MHISGSGHQVQASRHGSTVGGLGCDCCRELAAMGWHVWVFACSSCNSNMPVCGERGPEVRLRHFAVGACARPVHCGAEFVYFAVTCVCLCAARAHPAPRSGWLLWRGVECVLASACQPCGAALVRSRPSACLGQVVVGGSRVLCVLGMPQGNHVARRAGTTACVRVCVCCYGVVLERVGRLQVGP
jgi:hypothetical protein